VKVKELMERVGTTATGRAIAYIKDGLEEMNILSETHIDIERSDIIKGKRFYDLPVDMIKLIDVRAKNNLNRDNEYTTLPRMIGEPVTEDSDGF
jgi:hypothetical protein